ncbi:MAG: right-handed parallel beta-helix repeat-containing protein [Candidatus Hydrogenedentes bacterium]|nr:right-handed parallel beta-helix repeat-containing protein [Candidatus Hydrogenedentota bacterium]
MQSQTPELNRRDMLRAATGLMAGMTWARFAHAEDRPPVRRPRATSGDTAVEPDWEQRITITVGPSNADLSGTTEKVIQAAVDYVARMGGGTVQVLPGVYRLRNAVYIPSGIRIVGSGLDSVLKKEPSIETTLDEDSDWYDQEITLKDASGFQVGDGICLQCKNPHHGGAQVVKRTLVARSGNRFKLDKALRDNFWMDTKPSVATLFPLLTAEYATDITIENITLDGNRANNAHLDGNYAGGIWMQDCSRLVFRGVTSRNNNGDGLSWQICHDVLVEQCHSHDNADLGMHPGSGSQRPIMRNNTIERCGIGIFFCWGVKYGLAEKNTVTDIATAGVSIGHRDDENLVRDNDVLRSGQVGVLFRPERGEGYTPKGNRVENNRIVDSGGDDGIGVDVQGVTAGNTIARNEIRETRGPASRIGIRLGAESGENTLVENRIEGFTTPISDLRTR